MECELRSLRQAAQSQERTIQGLTESISTRDSEVCVCCIQFEITDSSVNLLISMLVRA